MIASNFRHCFFCYLPVFSVSFEFMAAFWEASGRGKGEWQIVVSFCEELHSVKLWYLQVGNFLVALWLIVFVAVFVVYTFKPFSKYSGKLGKVFLALKMVTWKARRRESDAFKSIRSRQIARHSLGEFDDEQLVQEVDPLTFPVSSWAPVHVFCWFSTLVTWWEPGGTNV